jgi:hypothetical protein
MKILRISLLLRLFKNSKNQKRFLNYINIGLFLSIFAISAAVISFYIEAKIDKIEFNLILLHKEKKSDQKTTNELINIQSELLLLNNGGKALIDLYEYTASTKLGEYTVSANDIYLPSVFLDTIDIELYLEFIDEDLWGSVIQVFAEGFGKESQQFKDFKEAFENLQKYENFLKKDFSKYYEKVFNYKAKEISMEVRNKKTINYWDDEVYEDYLKLDKILNEFLIMLEIMSEYYDLSDNYYETTISEENKKILDLSRSEARIIILAFIFQFFVFLIIQYFEVTSIQNEKGLNAKRKVK